MLYRAHSLCIYILCIHKRQKRLCQEHKISTLITQCSLQHCTELLSYAYIFENQLFPNTAVEGGQNLEAMGRRTALSFLVR
jgi:hypothetical protein